MESRSPALLAAPRFAMLGAGYGGLRDRFEPGMPVWITEIDDAACGGNPWAATFLDTFRYLDQHGRLARQGVSVLFHITLAASEYGLLDQDTNPNYWAALLWRRGAHAGQDRPSDDRGRSIEGGAFLSDVK